MEKSKRCYEGNVKNGRNWIYEKKIINNIKQEIMSEYKPFKMKQNPPKLTGNKHASPFKGFFGKLLNPAQMLPGKLGKLAGKLPGSNL